MITQQKKHHAHPLGRIIAVPVLALFLAAATTTAPAQNNPPAPASKSSSSPDSTQLLRLYCKNLRYPSQAAASGQEGTIRFSIQLDKYGSVKDFTPLGTPPPRHHLLKIVVMAYPPENPQSSLSKEDIQTLLLDEARRASTSIGQQLAAKGISLSSGEYYLEVHFGMDQQPKDKTKRS